jgi:hypothetical protein
LHRNGTAADSRHSASLINPVRALAADIER